MSAPTNPPAPMEWHPAYRDKDWLWDWLESKGAYADMDIIVVPIMSQPRVTWLSGEDFPLEDVSVRRLTLTKTKAWGAAPYVGDPFIYVWPVAYDDVGRAIAGESRIVYIPQNPGRP